MRKNVLAGIALLSAVAGAGLAALPTAASSAPVDGTRHASRSQEATVSVQAGPSTFVLSTAQHQFDAGVNNQGWWSDSESYANDDSNDNYALNGSDGGETRDFFTFDVSGLKRRHIVSATLRLSTADVTGLGGSEVLRLSDVSTDPVELNTNTGSSSGVFHDLGTGTVYGEFPFGKVHGDQQLALKLNKKALHGLKRAARCAPGGFFSIGGRLLSYPPSGRAVVFSNSQGRPVELVVRTRAKRPA